MAFAKGNYHRLKSTPNYSFVKILRVLPAMSQENKLPHVVVECEHTVNIGDTFGFIRRFRLNEICPTKIAHDAGDATDLEALPNASAESTPQTWDALTQHV